MTSQQMTHTIRDERLHYIPERNQPDPQTARLRDLIALIDQALTEDDNAKRAAKRHRDRAVARPDAPTVRPPTVAFIEDVEWMLGTGESVEIIAYRLGSTVNAIEVRLRRAGRDDLASKFTAAATAHRKAKARSVAA